VSLQYSKPVKPTTTTVNVIVYSEFDFDIKIDKNRVVLTNFYT